MFLQKFLSEEEKVNKGGAGESFPDNYSRNGKVSMRKEASRPHISQQACVFWPLIPETIPSKEMWPY